MIHKDVGNGYGYTEKKTRHYFGICTCGFETADVDSFKESRALLQKHIEEKQEEIIIRGEN